MKKSVLILALLVSFIFISCTDNLQDLEENTKVEKNEAPQTGTIDPPKDCPPNDRNCNGIPDDEE